MSSTAAYKIVPVYICFVHFFPWGGGGALGYFLGGCVPARTPNWYPILKKMSPKIETPL